MSWEVQYCPTCGSKLKGHEDDEDWHDFCAEYEKEHGTKWFLCSNLKCTWSQAPLVFFNSYNGWDSPAGDNWAIGYIK